MHSPVWNVPAAIVGWACTLLSCEASHWIAVSQNALPGPHHEGTDGYVYSFSNSYSFTVLDLKNSNYSCYVHGLYCSPVHTHLTYLLYLITSTSKQFNFNYRYTDAIDICIFSIYNAGKEKEVLAMENGGNGKVNAIFEAHLNNPAAKPTTGASGPVRERYIRDKYERRKYFDPSVMQSYAGGDGDDSSSSGSSSGAGPLPARRQASSVRAPSEAARLRAQARKPKIPVPTSSSSSSSIPKSRSVPVHHSKSMHKASTVSPPEIDLLDFSSPIASVSTNSGPPLQPPSANPSPTFDMFKNMKELNIHNESSASNTGSGSGSVTRSATMPVRAGNNLAPQMDSKKMTSDDILAMFHTPSTPQQSNFASFGNMNSNNMNNMNMNTMNNNNTNQMMMNNNSMMNGNMNMNNNMMMNNMNAGMMGGNSYGMQQRQQPQRNMMSMSGNSSSSIQNNGMGGMQGQGQMNFNNTMMPMGGAPSNMNMMGGSGMGSYNNSNNNQGNQNSMGMVDNRNGGQGGHGQGYGNVMGGSASQQSNQFASFGSFR